MRPAIRIPEFESIDERIRNLRRMAEQEPLLERIREHFETEMTLHLTPLKWRGITPSSSPLKQGQPEKLAQLKQAYLEAGHAHAIAKCLTDLSRQHLSRSRIKLLAEMLTGNQEYRRNPSEIHHPSGKRSATPEPELISRQLQKLVQHYHSSQRQARDHPLVIAAQLHHGIAAIQPFPSWNGRIARLLLNLALMKEGYLPVKIATSDRIDYYASLEAADEGDLIPLVQLLARKQLESIEEFTHSAEFLSIESKHQLQDQLQRISGNHKCLVLTEDSTTGNLLACLLKASGFQMEETQMISYEGCSKIASANLFAVFVKERMPHLKVLVHRDRDYLTNAEMEQQHQLFRRIDVRFFATDGTDIESHFLKAEHLNQLYPQLSLHDARLLVDQSIQEVLPKSMDYLFKKEFGSRRTEATHLYGAMQRLVERNRFRFTHGKTALKVLEHRVQDRIKRKVNLGRSSPALAHPKLQSIAESIWGTSVKQGL
jgi:Fic family protein